MTEIVRQTITKGGITESTVNKTYSKYKISAYQYKKNNGENEKLNENIEDNINNDDEDFPPLSTL